MSDIEPDTLAGVNAVDLARALQRGSISPSDVMAAFLERIETLNPSLNAIVSMQPRAQLMDKASSLEGREPIGPLWGLPVAIKDLVATKGIKTTYGSPLFADHVPAKDDLVAARLKAAGAIVIGKTNTSEWGHGSHTFNPVFGPTRNPHDHSRSAGGSSGGAASATAANLIPFADGSDAMGSLRNPAAFCNVYGFRPTWGLIPQDAGGETFLSTLATDGPIGRCPEDLCLLLSVLVGKNPEVPFCNPLKDAISITDANLVGKRIGWLADWNGAYATDPGILTTCETALKVFEDLGAVVEPLDPPFPADALWSSWTTLRAVLNSGTMGEIAEDPAQRALIKEETLWEIDRGAGMSAAAFFKASKIRSAWYQHAAAVFESFDFLALPSAQVWPFPVEWRWPKEINGREMDTYHRWMEVSVPASLIGLPSLSLPAGFSQDGLPTGLQLFGPTGSDGTVLSMGEVYHKATDWPRKRPPAL